MDCVEFRRRCDAEPHSSDGELAAHAASCEACERYLTATRALDDLVGAAARIDVPAARRKADSRLRPRFASRWLGAAAAAALAAIVVGGFWLGAPRPAQALGADVVEHIRGEREALDAGLASIDSADVRELLARHAITVRESIGTISYVQICPFRGRRVPHLVLAGERGPVTVLLLADEAVVAPIAVDAAGFTGRIVPDGRGSIAIVGDAPVDPALEARVVEAIEFAR